MTASPMLGGPTLVRWRILALLMAICLISHLNRAAMSVAGTGRIMDQFRIDPVSMGGIYTAFLVVYSLFMIPGGIFIDHFGPRRALMVVSFGSAMFVVLTGVTGWVCATGSSLVMALMGVRGLMGLVSAPLHPAAARSVGYWFPFAQRSWANGLVTAAAIAGIAVSYPGFRWLMQRWDWPAAFVFCGGLTAFVALLWSLVATDRPSQHSQVNATERELIGELAEVSPNDPAGGWAALLHQRSLILLTLSYAAVGYFQYLFVYWIEYYLKVVLQLDPSTSNYFATVPQIALALGMSCGGVLAENLSRRLGVRRGRAIVAGGGMTLSACFVGLGLLARDPVSVITWLALAHAAIGSSEGAFWATAVDLGANRGGTAAAICNTGGNVGGLLAPVLTPWVGVRFGWACAIALGGLICFLGAICWIKIDPRRQETR